MMKQQGHWGENHSRFQRIQGEGPEGWTGSLPSAHTRPRPCCVLAGNIPHFWELWVSSSFTKRKALSQILRDERTLAPEERGCQTPTPRSAFYGHEARSKSSAWLRVLSAMAVLEVFIIGEPGAPCWGSLCTGAHNPNSTSASSSLWLFVDRLL